MAEGSWLALFSMPEFKEMSALTAEIEAKGLKAYEQVLAFERLRSWRLPVTYVVFVLIPVFFGLVALRVGHLTMGVFQFGVAVLFAIAAWMQWRNLLRRYEKNLKVIAELEKTYGDELPWVKVNRHFAELEKLKEELARERETGE